jgi:hypothetical protein
MTASPSRTALLDQVDAAARQVQAGMHAQATRTGQPLRNIAADPWVRRVVADVGAHALAGRLRACRHLGSPQPVITAAWRRDLLACPPCAGFWFDLAGTKADRLCDRCGRDTADNGIHPGLVGAGAVLVMLGACDACHALLEAAAR